MLTININASQTQNFYPIGLKYHFALGKTSLTVRRISYLRSRYIIAMSEIFDIAVSSDVITLNNNTYQFLPYFSRISSIFPQDILPSGHFPKRQAGPQFLKRFGATSRQSRSICSATSLISHWALLQQR